MSEQKVEFEIEESSNDPAPIQSKTATMTEAEAETSGLSADEIVAGKKHGLIMDEKPVKKTDESKGAEEEEESGEEGKSEETEEVEDKDPKDAADEDLDPEEEQELVKNYNDNEKSLYWKAKKERLKRQNAQSENEHTKIKLAAAQREINLLKKVEKKADADGEEENTEDDDARVMTVGEFKKLLAKQKESQGKQNAEVQATIVRLESQEVEFKADHPDFDKVMELAKEMMDKKPSFRQMLLTAGADPNENAAEIAYSIGQLNPKYKKGGSNTVDKTGADTKTKVDKAIKNADKRTSSAAVAGGGTKRIVSEDDLTVEEAASLTAAQYGKLSRKTRDRLLKESCD